MDLIHFAKCHAHIQVGGLREGKGGAHLVSSGGPTTLLVQGPLFLDLVILGVWPVGP